MIQMLADTMGNADTGISGKMLLDILGWVTSFVVAVVGVLAVKGTRETAKAQGKLEGKAEALQIGPQPFEVAVQKSYVTREEWQQSQNDVRMDVREMKALYDKALTLINERDERTATQIKELGERLHTRISEEAEAGAERRRRIHDKLNIQADQLSRIDARTEVSKSIGRLGGAIMTLAKSNEAKG